MAQLGVHCGWGISAFSAEHGSSGWSWRSYSHLKSLLPGGSALLGSHARAAGRWSISLGRVDPDREGGGWHPEVFLIPAVCGIYWHPIAIG